MLNSILWSPILFGLIALLGPGGYAPWIAGVGTVNLDQRSFLLNFEITAFSTGSEWVRAVADMFETDFKSCTPATGADYRDQSLPFRIGVRIARLFSPIL